MTARAKRQRVPRSKGGRPTEAEIRHAAGERNLQETLLAYYGYPSERVTKLYAGGSGNIIPARIARIALYDPVQAAELIELELGAEHRAEARRGEVRYWRHDELCSNVYEGSRVFSTLFALSILGRAHEQERGSKYEKALELLCADLDRTQALYALLATPGVVRGKGGSIHYRGPVVRCAGMRSLPSRVAYPSTTAVPSALLGGGEWLRPMGPLERAIAELAEELGFTSIDSPHYLSAQYVWMKQYNETKWALGLGVIEDMLRGTRTKHPYRIAIMPDGTKWSALLGPIGPSSTAQIRYVCVRGPEAGDCEVLTPHVKDRKVPASDAHIIGGGAGPRIFETALGRMGDGGKDVIGPVKWCELPPGTPALQVDLGPDHDPIFTEGKP